MGLPSVTEARGFIEQAEPPVAEARRLDMSVLKSQRLPKQEHQHNSFDFQVPAVVEWMVLWVRCSGTVSKIKRAAITMAYHHVLDF